MLALLNLNHFISTYGYAAIFLLSILQSCCIPTSSELTLGFAGLLASQGKLNLAAVIFVGTAGEVVGAYIAWFIGRYGGRAAVDRYGKYLLLTHHDLDRAEGWYDRHGNAGGLLRPSASGDTQLRRSAGGRGRGAAGPVRADDRRRQPGLDQRHGQHRLRPGRQLPQDRQGLRLRRLRPGRRRWSSPSSSSSGTAIAVTRRRWHGAGRQAATARVRRPTRPPAPPGSTRRSRPPPRRSGPPPRSSGRPRRRNRPPRSSPPPNQAIRPAEDLQFGCVLSVVVGQLERLAEAGVDAPGPGREVVLAGPRGGKRVTPGGDREGQHPPDRG